MAYVVNGSCTLAALLPRHPLDLGSEWRGKRVLGDGKSIEGLLIGFNTGLITSVLLGLDFRLSVVAVTAALMGDLIGSFIKRRLGLKRGEEVPLMDQLGFIITTFIALSFFIELNYWLVFLLIILTYGVHRLANVIAYLLGLKNVPW